MTSSLAQFIAELQALDIHLDQSPEGNLKINAPKGVLTLDLQRELKDRKAEILAWLAGPAPAISPLNDQGLPATCSRCGNPAKWWQNRTPYCDACWKYLDKMQWYMQPVLESKETPPGPEEAYREDIPRCAVCGAAIDGYYYGDWLCAKHWEAEHEQQEQQAPAQREQVCVSCGDGTGVDCEACAVRSDMLAWGAAHNWPRFPVSVCSYIAEGEDHWRKYLARATLEHLHKLWVNCKYLLELELALIE